MTSNQHQEIILDSDQVRAALPAFASILDSLDARTLNLLRHLEEAQRGDPHKYLSGGIADGYNAGGVSRRATAELRDVIARVTQTLQAFDQHDQGVHTDPTAVELPAINGVPATLGLTTSDMSLAAMATRSEDVRSAIAADGPAARTDAAFEELDQSSTQTPAVPNTEGVAAIDGSGANSVVPVSLASADERTRSADPPDLSVNATVSPQTPAQLADASLSPPVPAVTPPPPPAIMPVANVEVTEDNRSWWDKLVDGFRWVGDQIQALRNWITGIIPEWIRKGTVSFFAWTKEQLTRFRDWMDSWLPEPVKVLINLLWGFIWGDPAFDNVWGSNWLPIGADVFAGLLVYGDIRDVFRYWMFDPSINEGDVDLNNLMGGIAILGVIPAAGDIGKPIVKQSLKQLLKLLGPEILKKVLKEVDPVTLTKLFLDIGEEGTERLLRELEPAAVKKLTTVLTPNEIKELHDKVGSQTLQKLVDNFSNDDIRKIASESAEKLRTRTLPSDNKRLDGDPESVNTSMNSEQVRAHTRQNESAVLMADKGYEVYQLPPPSVRTDPRNDAGLRLSRDPDLLIEGRVFDVYSPSTSQPGSVLATIQGKIANGQTKRIVLNLDDSNLSIDELKNELGRIPIAGLEEIIIVKDGSIALFYPF